MKRIISTSAVLLALAGLTFVGVRHGDSTVSAQPADNQVAPQPAATDVDEEPLAQGPADQAPQVDEAQLQAEQQAGEAELRPGDQAPAVDEAQLQAGQRAGDAELRPADQAPEVTGPANAGQPGQIEQQEALRQEALRQVTPRAPIFDASTARLSFQAVLTDNLGNALPGIGAPPSVDLQFQIYTSPGGVPVGAAINVCAVPIVNGVVDTQVPVPAASIDGTGRQMGVRIDTTGACAAFGPELAPRTELTAVPHAFRVDRVASAELDDNIALGDAATNGSLAVYSSASGGPGIFLDGIFGTISTYGTDGLEQTRLWNGSWGELYLFDESVTNDLTVVLSATSNSGGQLSLQDATAGNSVFLDGGTGTVNAEASLKVVDTIGGTTLGHINKHGGGSWFQSYDTTGSQTGIFGSAAGGDGGFAQLYNNSAVLTIRLDGDDTNAGLIEVSDSAGADRVRIDGESTGTGGEISVFDDNGTETVEILGAENAADGGQITIHNDTGLATIELDGDSGNSGFVSIRGADGATNIFLDGESGGAGLIQVDQNDASLGVTIDGDNGVDGGGMITVHDSVSQTRVQLLGESIGTGGEISVYDDDGTKTVEILGAESAANGPSIKLFRADGTGPSIEIDGEFGGDGRIITQELQITGGSDLSEQFDVQAAADGKVEPGMVVCIDPKRPGKLLVGAQAYDRTVAGIISGAGGLETGMYMGQRHSEEADGQYPVALTGRVYVWCDASQGAVEPGDMLTTSRTPGHAMKVTDHAKAQGAIIGKAMSSLKSGRGLVLVLVSLQ